MHHSIYRLRRSITFPGVSDGYFSTLSQDVGRESLILKLHLSRDSVSLQIQRKLQPPFPFKSLLRLASPIFCSTNTFLPCEPRPGRWEWCCTEQAPLLRHGVCRKLISVSSLYHQLALTRVLLQSAFRPVTSSSFVSYV